MRYIDDLFGKSDEDVLAASRKLKIKERILRRMRERGQSLGLTLEQYRDICETREMVECSACGGTGEVLEPVPRAVGCVHPSSSHGCRLMQYYDVVGTLAPMKRISPALQFTFQIGHAVHEQMQTALSESISDPDIFIPEAAVRMGIVSGSADGDMEIDGVGAVLEIKTDGPSRFPKRRSPDSKHIMQAMGMYATGLDRPFVVFLYVSKVFPHDIKEYVLPYNKKIYDKWCKTKGQYIEEALRTGVPPLADATASECSSCNYGYIDGCPQNISDRKATAFTNTRRFNAKG